MEAERPRRTGSPASAGYDGFGGARSAANRNESVSRPRSIQVPFTTSTPREEQARTAIPSQTWRSLDV
jgi:hypothetical protein